MAIARRRNHFAAFQESGVRRQESGDIVFSPKGWDNIAQGNALGS
jgi:hypothetical protein